MRYSYKGSIIGLLVFVFTVGVTSSNLSWAQQTPKTVLILHSYHKAAWTDSLLDGIESELGSIADLDLVIEYMDTKRIKTEAYYQAIDEIYKMKYSREQFNVLLATDDNAYRFALARQNGLFKEAPIVFCGVNRFNQNDIEDKPFVTGVLEKGDFHSTLAFASRVCKDAATVHVIVDNTSTGKINKEAFLKVLHQQLPNLGVAFLTDISLSDLAKKLAGLPANDFAFFISFWMDGTGQSVSPDNLSAAFYKSSVPIFGRSEWMLNKGLTGGKCVSGFHQGQAAAQLVKRILAGENAATIPINKNSPNRFMFDYSLLNRYGINLSELPPESILYNKPKPTFYEMHRRLIWSIATGMSILLVLVISLTLNIIMRRKTEKALRESEKRFRMLFEFAPDAYYLSDFEGNFIDGNKKAEYLLGYQKQELIGKNFLKLDLLPEVELLKAAELLTENLEGKSTGPDEITLKRKNGHNVTVEISTIPINIGGQDVVLGIARDMTERKQSEEALRESEEKLARSKKMESLGLLAGGVAHDLNNVLSGIVNYPELLLMDLPEDSKFRKSIEAIQDSGYRAAAIVQDLLTVARGVAITREPLNINKVVDEYLESPEFNKLKQFYPAVTIKTELNTSLFNISGSLVHIEKILMNLVSNAAEAIKGSGIITISSVNRYLDRPLRGYDDVKSGEYVVLSVADDGPGIKPGDLERVFEPFYTKKAMGRSGTGLGLAVVWNIMLDHKGYIDVITDENGTTFELYFPMTREDISGKGLLTPIQSYKGNGETILVVDDVASQRDICCRILDVLGYQTKAASSGEEAIEYLKQNSVDLILLDMIMDPGMNGRETYEGIIEIHPGQKAIIVSGFAITEDVKAVQKLGAGKYIKKPYSIEKIGLAVKEELGN